MKIGILTFPNSISYGAALQMFALQHQVKRLGHRAEIINYHNDYMKRERHSSKKNVARQLARRLMHHRQYRAFRRFEGKMTLYPAKPVSTSQELARLSDRYDAVICGSDQVWNPDITGGDLSYFLDFCGEGVRRISYAPSFGVESLPEEFAAHVAGELKRFSGISLRERQGQQLVEQLMGRTYPLVLDPTFLLEPEDWAAEEAAWPAPQEGYILCYTIRSSESLKRFCGKLSEKTGLKIVVIGGNRLRHDSGSTVYASDITPGQWLYLMRNARYVVTNSFHGTAFSVNFRKDFFVEFSSLTNSRLENIVTTLGLQDRVLKPEKEPAVEPADYSRADTVLKQMREASAAYLKNAIEGTL